MSRYYGIWQASVWHVCGEQRKIWAPVEGVLHRIHFQQGNTFMGHNCEQRIGGAIKMVSCHNGNLKPCGARFRSTAQDYINRLGLKVLLRDFMIPSRNKERAPKFLVVVKICINTLAMMFGKSWYFLFVFAGSGKVGTTFRRKIGFHYRKEAKYRLKFPNFCSQVCKKVPFLYSNLIRVASRDCSILFYFLISKLPNPIFSLIKKSLILLLSCPLKDLLAEWKNYLPRLPYSNIFKIK